MGGDVDVDVGWGGGAVWVSKVVVVEDDRGIWGGDKEGEVEAISAGVWVIVMVEEIV